MKVQPMRDLIAQMRAVTRGETAAPADAAEPSVESAEALLRILTPDNRNLLRTIRDAKPQSIAELEGYCFSTIRNFPRGGEFGLEVLREPVHTHQHAAG